MIKKTLALSFAIIVTINLHGQVGRVRGLVYNYVEKGSYDKEIEAQIPMSLIESQNGVFCTTPFAKANSNLKIPEETFSLDYPDMSACIDTIYIIWFLKDLTYLRSGVSNIIILGVTEDGNTIFFIDNDNDRHYEKGETVFSFDTDKKNRKIPMTFGNKNEYFLSNPFYEPSESKNMNEVNAASWESVRNEVSLYLYSGFSFGKGDALISYVPKDHDVDRIEYFGGIFASLRYSLGMGVEWRNLNLIAWGAFEVLDYDEIHRYEFFGSHRTIKYNTGVWMKTKLYGGCEIGYDIRLIKSLIVGPAISYSWWKAIGNKPIDPNLEYDKNARYDNTYVLDYILRMRVISSDKSKLELRLYFSDTFLDAREFFPDYGSEYFSNYKQIYFGAGYIYRFI